MHSTSQSGRQTPEVCFLETIFKQKLNFWNLSEYIDYEIALQVFETCDIFHAKSIFTGTMEKCLNFDYNFQSLIPKWLKLPLFKDKWDQYSMCNNNFHS